jgi:hypothetical protein
VLPSHVRHLVPPRRAHEADGTARPVRHSAVAKEHASHRTRNHSRRSRTTARDYPTTTVIHRLFRAGLVLQWTLGLVNESNAHPELSSRHIGDAHG